MNLGTWRQRVANLTQTEAAARAGIPQALANQIETSTHRASLGAVANYVRACGGRLRVTVEISGQPALELDVP